MEDIYKKKVSYYSERLERIRNGLIKKLTRRALPVFVRGGDLLSFSVLANGNYEPEITDLINYLANDGYSDFLIDVGANIGLSSIQCGSRFKEIHMFEPNPDACAILGINARIALENSKYFIYNFGLGSIDGIEELYVPKLNWGGAFVRSPDNSYSDEILAVKDGHKNFAPENYRKVSIEIRSVKNIFTEIFKNFMSGTRIAGVIKIDAEGYEKKIIDEVIPSIPANMSVWIIFENWDASTAIAIPENSERSARMFELKREKHLFKSLPRWIGSLINFLRDGYFVRLVSVDKPRGAGTFVVFVN